MQQVDATQSGDPSFHGGEAFFSWLITVRCASTTRRTETSNRSHRCGPSSRADPAPGKSWRTSTLSISTAGQSRAASSGASRPRSTGICRTTCASNSPTGRIAQSLWPGRQDALLPDPHQISSRLFSGRPRICAQIGRVTLPGRLLPAEHPRGERRRQHQGERQRSNVAQVQHPSVAGPDAAQQRRRRRSVATRATARRPAGSASIGTNRPDSHDHRIEDQRRRSAARSAPSARRWR